MGSKVLGSGFQGTGQMGSKLSDNGFQYIGWVPLVLGRWVPRNCTDGFQITGQISSKMDSKVTS